MDGPDNPVYRMSDGTAADEDVKGCVAMAVDDSAQSDKAVRWVSMNMIKEGQTMSLIHVYPEASSGETGRSPEHEQDGKAVNLLLTHAVQVNDKSTAGQVHVHAVASTTAPGKALTGFIAEQSPSYLVVGARSMNKIERKVLASVSDYCIRKATVPVLVIKEDSHNIAYNLATLQVVIAIDSSEHNAQALTWYLAQPFMVGAKITLLHVKKEGVEFQSLLATAARRCETAGHICKVDVIDGRGRPQKAIVQYLHAKQSDVLLMGSRGIGKVKRTILGSVSEHCVHHAPCPVMVYRDASDSGGAAHPPSAQGSPFATAQGSPFATAQSRNPPPALPPS